MGWARDTQHPLTPTKQRHPPCRSLPTCSARRSSSLASRALWSCRSRSWAVVKAGALGTGGSSFWPLAANVALKRSIASCKAPARCSLAASYAPERTAKLNRIIRIK